MPTHCTLWWVRRSSPNNLGVGCKLCSARCTLRCDTWTCQGRYTQTLHRERVAVFTKLSATLQILFHTRQPLGNGAKRDDKNSFVRSQSSHLQVSNPTVFDMGKEPPTHPSIHTQYDTKGVLSFKCLIIEFCYWHTCVDTSTFTKPEVKIKKKKKKVN